MPQEHFTWVPLYQELAEKLRAWEDRQDELIAFLERLREQGFVITPLNDKDENGDQFLIQEIDPFTIFGVFNRGIRQEQRIGILNEFKKHFACDAEVPNDFDGIPILNNQRSWFIAYDFLRKREDVGRLWKIFCLALHDDPLNSPEFKTAYDDAMKVRGVNVNLSMGLFWIRSDTFLNLDSTNRKYLSIDAKAATTASAYCTALNQVADQRKESFVQISYDAYLAGRDEPTPPPKLPDDEAFWFVGAYWTGSDPHNQTQRFLDEGIWQNGYKNKFLDEVRSMKVGERIAIKAVSTQKKNLPFDSRGNTASKMTIKARGTIVANRGDGRTVEIEWDADFQPKEWYFFTYQHTVWKLQLHEDYTNKEYAERLIQFAFYDRPQDYDWFCERWYGGDDDLDEDDDTTITRPYSLEDIIAEGAFLSEAELERILSRLRSKKNLILQGAPGVGKTFLARRLAFALMEEVATDRTQFVQFHQSYSYEDFVRGYRPLPEEAGSFGLQDAVFFTFCEKARDDPDRAYVLMIDEINRGNLSQIFGELLMLIESDKRNPEFAIPLMYPRADEPDFSVPENLYIIGMMNLADRSLALVDYALRRRFAFATLESRFNSDLYRNWLLTRQMGESLADLIIHRLTSLNQEIADDDLLGKNYQIGHSFFCPKGNDFAELDRDWYDSIIETEIAPLLYEYWFDNAEKAEQAKQQLLSP